MKNKIFKLNNALYAGAFLLLAAACQDDEVLNLIDYPAINVPEFTINGTENASNVELSAVYGNDGELHLNGQISRTFTFRINASREDAKVTFTPILVNIPEDKLEMDTREVFLPAGSTDAVVTLSLKDNDFSFAKTTKEEMVYEMGVKAFVEGPQMTQNEMEAKVTIKKSAFSAVCSLVGPDNNKASFQRAIENGEVKEKEPIEYKFRLKLDKPALDDVKYNITAEGVPEDFVKDVTMTPAEIIIPAGQRESEEITWSMKNDFLLTTPGKKFTFKLKAAIETEGTCVTMNEETNLIELNVSKMMLNLSASDRREPGWSKLSKEGWKATDLKGFDTNHGEYIINGIDGIGAWEFLMKQSYTGEFILDMANEKTVKGLEFYYFNAGYGAREIEILTSNNKESWTNHGKVEVPNRQVQYVKLLEAEKTRYIKVLMHGYYGNCWFTEVSVFE